MTRQALLNMRRSYFQNEHKYTCTHWCDFDFDVLNKIMYITRAGRGDNDTYNDVILMFDTETSKQTLNTVCSNYVVAWTISIRAFNTNIATIYGSKPSELIYCMERMHKIMPGDKTIFYAHNYSYDYVFARKFMFVKWGTPQKQLNTKSHYPLFMEFANGIIIKDSLILAQRRLEKWAEDLNVEHQKAVGKWNYNKIRHQGDGRNFTADEIEYIEHDTLAGVECIQKTMDTLNKRIYSMPYTATGIPREAVRTIGKKYHARDLFLRIVPDYHIQEILEKVYHGGYTHGNRHYISRTVTSKEYGKIIAKDFASSYPFCLLARKFPMERFSPTNDCSIKHILQYGDKYAFIFKLILVNVKLKSDAILMPALQYSKCTQTINAVEDNGRILTAKYLELYTNETDLKVINEQYEAEQSACVEVYSSKKDYLPRWFTDYVFDCFKDKCELKGGDPVLYSIAKAKLNSLYGMICQHPCRLMIEEDYQTGDYSTSNAESLEELYEKYTKKFTSILPYQWGVWVTSYAFENLFTLGKCINGIWLYSDTDSAYATNWDEEKVNAYNEKCKEELKANGYGAVTVNGKEFWLGIAEEDGVYSQFRCCGSKRYCVRYAPVNGIPGKLKLTVAGVPKKGVKCLKNNIKNFHKEFIFDGKTTGKLQHTYFFEPEIWIDEHGNERADSIDLSPCEYKLDDVTVPDWEKLWEEDIELQIYEEGNLYEY